MQSTFKNTRKQLIIWLFNKSQKSYVRYFKKQVKAWNITKEELFEFPKYTFGYHYGQFLKENDFEMLSKLERHDAFHIITGYKTLVQDEIALQYLCYGNGKRSLYLFGVIFLGTMILPDYLKYYMQSYRNGKKSNRFYDLNFESLLNTNLQDLQEILFNKTYLLHKLHIKLL